MQKSKKVTKEKPRLTKKQWSIIVTGAIVIVAIMLTVGLDENVSPTIWVCALVLAIFFNLWIFIKKDISEHNYQKNLIQAAGFGLIAISWFIGGYFTNQQSVLQEKRDLKVRMLTDAFFKLQNINNRQLNETPSNAYIYYKYSENALNEIELIGEPELVRRASVFALSNGTSGYNELLIELRNELRKELGVSSITEDDLKPFSFSAQRKLLTTDTLTSKEEIDLIIRLNEDHKDLFK